MLEAIPKQHRNIQVSKITEEKGRDFLLPAAVGFQLHSFKLRQGQPFWAITCRVLIPFPFGLHFSRDGADDPKLREEEDPL